MIPILNASFDQQVHWYFMAFWRAQEYLFHYIDTFLSKIKISYKNWTNLKIFLLKAKIYFNKPDVDFNSATIPRS
jgi:predicted Rdx family selenoprotein